MCARHAVVPDEGAGRGMLGEALVAVHGKCRCMQETTFMEKVLIYDSLEQYATAARPPHASLQWKSCTCGVAAQQGTACAEVWAC